MPHLKMLNIRNMPVAVLATSWVDQRGFLEALATRFMNKLLSNLERSSLDVLALGLLTYGELRSGSYYHKQASTADYLRLRIYKVQYLKPEPRFGGRQTAKMHLISEGTADDAEAYIEDMSIFRPYWLDGTLREKHRAWLLNRGRW